VASPSWGDGRLPHAFDYALLFTAGGNWRENDLDLVARGLCATPWHDDGYTSCTGADAAVVTTDRDDVAVVAVKAASRGEGIIARLYSLTTPPPAVTLALAHGQVEHAVLCDARERDLAPLEIDDGRVLVPMPGALATIRLYVKREA